ncbi:hypothetical protein [Pyrobaculum neutrophilum]|uniref:Uncharacterized protein n=1 Tax=Pyrobaculum neutrophilum (strain DSM 2338 / JCM 9278 / NBRC 100436 / V24Sta) TaxID=444157 RepID=B1YAP1_PYRNV|nr:hypothetical protein [Pyrobaculum neutrophilum]ACB39120.1 conserved hypothetical protein [Pyrobaculum neutrophilum V24Sta]
MVDKGERRKRRGKIFLIALLALIFAETGYILGTTGLGPLIFGRGGPTPTTDFSAVLSVSQAYVFYHGNVTRAERPPQYGNAYVYIVPYRPGLQIPQAVAQQIALDAAERPVYVLPVLQYNTPIDPVDFAIVLPTDGRNPVVLLTYSATDFGKIESWLLGVQNQLKITISGYARVSLENGRPSGVRLF